MALALLMVINVNDLVQSKEYVKILKVKYFKPQETFNTNGFYITFARSINDLQVKKPKEYSVQKVEKLAEQFKGTKTTVSNDKKPNIIMIMSEAYTDFMSFADVPLSEDNMPFFHSLKKNTIKGSLYMSIFGSGTCNSEFEYLTGNSMSFLQNGIIAYTQVVKDKLPNMTYLLKEQGYKGNLALHPYLASGWNRDGLALRAAGDLLQYAPGPAPRHLLIVLTDASPNDSRRIPPSAENPLGCGYEDAAGVADTAAQVRALQRMGIRVSAVFMGEDSSAGAAAQIYGKNMARIRGMDQLARAAGRLIQNEIRELGD